MRDVKKAIRKAVTHKTDRRHPALTQVQDLGDRLVATNGHMMVWQEKEGEKVDPPEGFPYGAESVMEWGKKTATQEDANTVRLNATYLKRICEAVIAAAGPNAIVDIHVPKSEHDPVLFDRWTPQREKAIEGLYAMLMQCRR